MNDSDEDIRLMLAFCAGDASAFDALFRRWAGPLLRYLERMVHDVAIAEELVQDAFLRVYRARDRYAPDARFSTWLYRIATNLALNELRRPHRRHVHSSADDSEGAPLALRADGPPTDEVVHAHRLGDEIESALAELPERQRSALWLVAVQGASYAEVAESLETSEKSVKSLVHRARATLSKLLDARRGAARSGTQ